MQLRWKQTEDMLKGARELRMTASGFSRWCEAKTLSWESEDFGRKKKMINEFLVIWKATTRAMLLNIYCRNHLGTLLTCRSQFSRSKWGLNFCICNKLLGNACAVSPAPSLKQEGM